MFEEIMKRDEFCKGYTWGFFSRNKDFLRPEAESSMRRLASNGLNWICIPVNGWQETFHSVNIFSAYGLTQTDEEIKHAVNLAHSLGLKVCLKPMVNCMDHAWRAKIDFPTERGCNYWEQWFGSYKRFLLYYAQMAEELGCEMLCTGCEMAGMDKQADYCVDVIEQVRKVYQGLLMHNINHGDELCSKWLSAVDIIGISAYYPVSDKKHRDIDTMRTRWKKVVTVLEKCHKKYDRPIMFAEIGVRNERGCSAYPWDFLNREEEPSDEQEQSDFYESAMEATWDLDWFMGYFWWDWKAILPPEEEAHKNKDFTVYGKLAEQTLKKWYTRT
jgi:hypothetical protein